MAKGLGKGLSALLGESTDSEDMKIQNIDIGKLKPGKYQPRGQFNDQTLNDLSQSIKEKGILQPLLLSQMEDGQYEIIAGERRWRAAKKCNLKHVPAIIRHFNDQEALEVGLIENLQREDLNDIEEAEGYARLAKDFEYSQQKIADIVGKSRPYIANSLRLNKLPAAVKAFIKQGTLTGGHARALVGAPNAAEIAKDIIARNLNVRQAEALMRKQKNPSIQKSAAKSSKKDADIINLEKHLIQKLGIRVEIKNKSANRGVISLSYDNMDQLDMLLKKLDSQ